MTIDIDFVPSDGFWQFLTEPVLYSHMEKAASADLRVWAMVSLELHETYLDLPSVKSAVAECLSNRSVVVAETYLNPAAHAPVQIDDWLTRTEVCA